MVDHIQREEFFGASEINIDLWPPGAWTEDELNEFKQIVSSVAPTSGQISSGMRGLSVHIILSFLALAAATGFFGKLGSDLYDYLRSKLKDRLLKRQTKTSYPVEGLLAFDLRGTDESLSLYYQCLYSEEQHLDVLFSSVNALHLLLLKAAGERTFPFDHGAAYDLHAQLDLERSRTWNVRLLRRMTDTGDVSSGELFEVDIDPEQISTITPADLEWRDIPRLSIGSEK